MHCDPPAITFIPCETHFRPVLPTIEGNVDYLALRGQLTTIDELLRTSGVENEFVTRSLKHWVKTLSQSKVEYIRLGERRRCLALSSTFRRLIVLTSIRARLETDASTKLCATTQVRHYSCRPVWIARSPRITAWFIAFDTAFSS